MEEIEVYFGIKDCPQSVMEMVTGVKNPVIAYLGKGKYKFVSIDDIEDTNAKTEIPDEATIQEV